MDGNKDKDGGFQFDKKYGKISIKDYKQLLEENQVFNKNKIKPIESFGFNNPDEEEKDSEILIKKSHFKLNTNNLSKQGNKNHLATEGSIKLNKISGILSKEIERIDIPRFRINLTENEVKGKQEPQPLLIDNNKKIINNFNKEVITNHYWGSQKGVDMIHRRQIKKGFGLMVHKHKELLTNSQNINSSFIRSSDNNKIKMKVNHKDFKLPDINSRSRDKYKLDSMKELPFII